MGEADVAQVRAWAAQVNTADDPVRVWVEQICSPEIDYRAVEGALDDVGPIIGSDALRAYVSDWYETFDGFKLVLEDAVDAGPGCVLASFRITGTARASGVATDMPVAVIYWISDHKVVKAREYWTVEEARAALAAGA